MKTLLLVIVTLLTGCMGEVWYVDERFTTDEEAEIQAAAESWEAIGAEPLALAYGQHVVGNETGKRVIARVGERGALNLWAGFSDSKVAAVHRLGLDYARIIVNIDRVLDGDLQMTVAHEFGHHYLGSEHSSHDDALMNPTPCVRLPTVYEREALRLSREPGL